MSFSMNKLKSFLPGHQSSSTSSSSNSASRRHTLPLEAEIGFQLTISTNCKNQLKTYDKSIPELVVTLLAARHLPSSFGFKNVQGYIVKVKLFPGTIKFDSIIQTSTWPKFNETFNFPLEPAIKSSFKNYSKDKVFYENLPEKLFSGHFVVFTMYALLELPPGSFNRFRGTYRSLRDKSSTLMQRISEQNVDDKDGKVKEKNKVDMDENVVQLTKSETRRNIGSVTCYLETKLFKKNIRTEEYETDELWLPIRDLTLTSLTNKNTSNLAASTKGQLEIILELCDKDFDDSPDVDSNLKNSKQKWKSHYSDLKRKLKTGKSQDQEKSQFLKIITSKMRCSIKVKEDFEQTAGLIYIKTQIYDNNIPIDSWKCENFFPSISSRWDPNSSTICIPFNFEKKISELSIKSTVATKNKVGKKIILGTIVINTETTQHLQNTMNNKNESIAMWHNFQ